MKTLATAIAYLLLTTAVFAQDLIISEEVLIMNDSIKLPGTLTYNSKLSSQPLIIFVQGSGNPDRNGNQLEVQVKANYIKQLSDSMNVRNIAFFRYDKRNVTKENIKFLLKKYLFDDLVSDVSAIIEHFKEDSRFSQIILVGHSQGSLVGMLAANDAIDKYVSLAGLGRTADRALIDQISAQNKDFGNIAQEHMEELKTSGEIKEINPFLMAIFAPANHEFLLSYIQYDPVSEIQKLKIPSLIINGDMDTQVTEEDANALHEALPNSTLVIIQKMNHVLKEVSDINENMSSYYSEGFPISTELIEVLNNFITNNE